MIPESATAPESSHAHAEGEHASASRLLVLDGWRAVSILLVLAAHMLPLGPKRLEVNTTVAAAGMSLFFTLSGFLITTNLLKHPDVINFLIRRGCRILPLATIGVLVYMLVARVSWRYGVANLLFLENYLHDYLIPHADHLWSLCVEVHFYLFVALLVAIAGVSGLLALPVVALLVTASRVVLGNGISIETHQRVDEILAGAILALAYADRLGEVGRRWAATMRAVPLWVWIPLLLAASIPWGGPMRYPRPYFGSAVVGHTLFVKADSWRWLRNRIMRYIAEISYALYVVHPLSMVGWIGSGGTVVKYLKRPLCFAISFGLAHLSTFHMERHFIAWGKALTHRREQARRSRSSAGAAVAGKA